MTLGMKAQSELYSPSAFDDATRDTTPEQVRRNFRVSADVERHLEWLAGDAELGFEALYLHNVHRDQEQFIRTFADKVLPQLHTA